jgi:glycosyltransferase involved in cell wall biosynthesis
MGGTPRYSVILLAYNRKQYVIPGVTSALNQSLPRDQYEILVFKNFEDPEIDGYLAAHGVRNLTSEPDARPRTMRTVLDEAKADVLCFLDDDDIWLRDKLAFVDREFTADPTLGYFHNGFEVVDENLRPFSRSPFPQPGARLVIRAGDPRSRPVPANALRIGFNSSSVSVRRGWLTPFLPSFEHREAELSDAMMLATALISGWTVTADPTKLTLYRYHDSWTNTLHYTADSIGPIAELDTLNLALLHRLAGLADGTTLAPLIEDDIQYIQFHRSIFVDGVDWRPRVSDYVRFLFGSAQQRNIAPLYLIPLHVMARISRARAREAYFRLAENHRRYSFRGPGFGA